MYHKPMFVVPASLLSLKVSSPNRKTKEAFVTRCLKTIAAKNVLAGTAHIPGVYLPMESHS